MPPFLSVALHRRRRRVTPEATIAADSELTKRRLLRCRSIVEKNQGVDRGAPSSYATAQHRRCLEDPLAACRKRKLAALLPREKNGAEVRLHAVPPSLVFTTDAATLS
nr:hypothetical protein Iba_scaffold65972CG0010 [Ipomoea batatas]